MDAESLETLHDWLSAIASKPTALNDLQVIAKAVAELDRKEVSDRLRILATIQKEAAVAMLEGDPEQVHEAVVTCFDHLLILAEQEGFWLGEALVARLRARVDQLMDP